MRSVSFPVDCATAYDYLVDPAHRAQWQSSLKDVVDVVGETDVVGQSWTDVTSAGVRPRMELTDADRPHRWTERGTWRSFSAVLTLSFTPATRGCDVAIQMHLHAHGPVRPLAAVLDRLAPLAVRSDLVRAARLLAAR